MTTTNQLKYRYKWLIFILLIVAKFGCFVIESKKENMIPSGDSNAYFRHRETIAGIFISIIGGILCDKFGSVKLMLLFQSVIALGQLTDTNNAQLLLNLRAIILEVGKAGFNVSLYASITSYFRGSGHLLFAVNTYTFFSISKYTLFPKIIAQIPEGQVCISICMVVGIISSVGILMIQNKTGKTHNLQIKVENTLEIRVINFKEVLPKEILSENKVLEWNIFWILSLLNICFVGSMGKGADSLIGNSGLDDFYELVYWCSPIFAWIADRNVKYHSSRWLKLGFYAVLFTHLFGAKLIGLEHSVFYIFLGGEMILKMMLYGCAMLVVDANVVGKASGFWFATTIASEFIIRYLLKGDIVAFICSFIGAIVIWDRGLQIQGFVMSIMYEIYGMDPQRKIDLFVSNVAFFVVLSLIFLLIVAEYNGFNIV